MDGTINKRQIDLNYTSIGMNFIYIEKLQRIIEESKRFDVITRQKKGIAKINKIDVSLIQQNSRTISLIKEKEIAKNSWK